MASRPFFQYTRLPISNINKFWSVKMFATDGGRRDITWRSYSFQHILPPHSKVTRLCLCSHCEWHLLVEALDNKKNLLLILPLSWFKLKWSWSNVPSLSIKNYNTSEIVSIGRYRILLPSSTNIGYIILNEKNYIYCGQLQPTKEAQSLLWPGIFPISSIFKID